MPLSRGRAALGVSASGGQACQSTEKSPGLGEKRPRDSRDGLRSVGEKPRNRLGTEITHCGTGTSGMTCHDDWAIFQASPDELPVIDIHSL